MLNTFQPCLNNCWQKTGKQYNKSILGLRRICSSKRAMKCTLQEMFTAPLWERCLLALLSFLGYGDISSLFQNRKCLCCLFFLDLKKTTGKTASKPINVQCYQSKLSLLLLISKLLFGQFLERRWQRKKGNTI